MHGGRPIRVQLRDRNPASRGMWRPGRGRGRSLFGGHAERHLSLGGPLGPTSNLIRGVDTGPPSMDGISIPQRFFQTDPGSPGRTSPDPHVSQTYGPRARVPQDVTNASSPSISSTTTKVPSLICDISHGAPSTVASSTSPPLSASVTTPSSSTAPMAPYAMNVGFLPPQPWIPPYSTPYPYAVPLVPGYGYAGYPYPSVQPLPPPFLSRDAPSNQTSNAVGPNWTPPSVEKVGSTI